jgi:hypothetical protein
MKYWGQFGSIAATRSPRFTPYDASAAANASDARSSSASVNTRPLKRNAGYCGRSRTPSLT